MKSLILHTACIIIIGITLCYNTLAQNINQQEKRLSNDLEQMDNNEQPMRQNEPGGQSDRDEFIRQTRTEYQQFVDNRNAEMQKMDDDFREFLKQEWQNFKLFKEEYKSSAPKPSAAPAYKPTDIQPKSTQLKVDKVTTIESYTEAPRLPFMAKNTATESQRTATFDFYGEHLSVPFDAAMTISLDTVSEQKISDMWQLLSNSGYSSTIVCLTDSKSRMSLNDWGYYLLVRKAAQQIAHNANGQVLLTWFLLTKSNYITRLAYKNNTLYLLLASANNIYGKPYFKINNKRFYMIDGQITDVYTYNQDFPEARTIFDLNIYKPINTAEQLSNHAVHFGYDGKQYQFNISYNQNLINFYNDYPQADIKIYFDATIGSCTKESLTAALLPAVSSMDKTDAAGLLLNMVQSFDYKTDDQQFGHEKFFFPDEMFHYQYSDCEDRAVLYAYLVKLLLGLDVVGINYPGHMATAVAFDSKVEGSYIVHNGRRYTICDPTYIGAPVGEAMPQYANVSAAIIENASQPNIADRAGKLWRIANKYGLYQGDNSNNIVFDADNNAYMCGYFSGNVDFMGRKLSAEGTDAFVAKITADNTLDFMFSIGGKTDDMAYNIILDGNNGFCFSGSFNGTITAQGKTLKADGGDLFVARCSRDGNLEWISRANIAQADNDGRNIIAANFNSKGKLIWLRNYVEDESYSDYGISIDNNGNTYLTASLLSATGVMQQSYESYAQKSAFMVRGASSVENNTPTAPEISGLFAVVDKINSSKESVQGSVAQKVISSRNPDFSKHSPDTYNKIADIEFIRNAQGIVTIRTANGKPVVLNGIRLSNNSKFKITVYSSGNAQIDFLSGSQYNNGGAWYTLNSIKLNKASGNLTYDYDADHTQKIMNARNAF